MQRARLLCALIVALAPGLGGCGAFDSPMEIKLDSTSYRWGDRIKITYDFEEPPPGVDVPVRLLLVGSLPGAPEPQPVLEKSLGLLVNQALDPDVRPISLPSVTSLLPANIHDMDILKGAPPMSELASKVPSICWEIVARAPSTGEEDREPVELRGAM